jgi:hypothetical protein
MVSIALVGHQQHLTACSILSVNRTLLLMLLGPHDYSAFSISISTRMTAAGPAVALNILWKVPEQHHSSTTTIILHHWPFLVRGT